MQDISEDVLRKASEGDLESFELIYRAASSFVYNLAYRIVNNREDADEVAQEVFIIIFHKLKGFRFESSFKTWVYRITVNYAVNFFKKMSRHRFVEYDDTRVKNEDLKGVMGEMEKEENRQHIEKLLADLNPDQRTCVVLRNIEGLSYQQIAEVLKININTVRTRLKRARERLWALRKKVPHGLV